MVDRKIGGTVVQGCSASCHVFSSGKKLEVASH